MWINSVQKSHGQGLFLISSAAITATLWEISLDQLENIVLKEDKPWWSFYCGRGACVNVRMCGFICLGFFSLNNCYKKPLRQELFKCRAGRLVVSGGHPHNRAVMVCTFQEFLTDEWHVANFSADHMYSTVFITQSSIFSPISYLVFQVIYLSGISLTITDNLKFFIWFRVLILG